VEVEEQNVEMAACSLERVARRERDESSPGWRSEDEVVSRGDGWDESKSSSSCCQYKSSAGLQGARRERSYLHL
jgi:hypothetical protein